MRTKEKAKPLSPRISEVCSLFSEAVKTYQWSLEELTMSEKLTQDLLHSLELGDLDYRKRARVATQLRKCRQQRRVYKDTVEIYAPLVEHLESETGKRFVNLLKEVLGKTRKSEERTEGRIYFPRVLQEPPIQSRKEAQP